MTRFKIALIVLLLAPLSLLGLSCGNKKQSDAGVYKSTDGGETWEQKVKIDDKNDISGLSVNEVAIDPSDSNIVFVGTELNGIYKSTDGGDTWQQTALRAGNIYSLDINPNDSSVIYAAGSANDIGQIYKSSDGGNNWEEVYAETHDDTVVNDVVADWYDPRRVYAGTSNGALLKSKDSGRSWVAIRWFEEGESVNGIAVGYQDSRQLFVATSESLYQSSDGGKIVTDIKDKVESIGKASGIHDIVAHPEEKSRVYLIGEIGFLISYDWGQTWQKVNILANPEYHTVANIALDPKDAGKIYFTFDSNLYKTADGGANWSVKQFTTGKLRGLAVDPGDTSVLYTTVLSTQQQ
ncbi:hypothetical protein KJ903_00755 [Patescibacteria group bacterium]|nr:hypothetical protein [Patescibacteria group bacterium]